MTSKVFDTIIQTPGLLTSYNEGMSHLYRSGVITALKELGRVRPVPADTPNYQQIVAHEAMWSLGFNQAIEMLMSFRELFLDKKDTTNLTPDFGGIESALEKGDLTQEEADALREK